MNIPYRPVILPVYLAFISETMAVHLNFAQELSQRFRSLRNAPWSRAMIQIATVMAIYQL